MKPIDTDDYFEMVMKGFANVGNQFETETMTVITEEIFKIAWMTSVRFNNFITFADSIDLYRFQVYVNECLNMTRQNRSKLGFPSVCNAVLITENAPKSVIDHALKRPAMHPNMTEYPIVIDLAKGESYFYTGIIIYGVLYAKFEREYIDGHFALPLRVLKGKRK